MPVGNGSGPPKQFSVVSLFSGAMGLDLGLEATGRFRTLAVVEKVPAFCNTIRLNRDAGRVASRDLRVIEGDISSVDPRDLLNQLDLKPGELDLLVGGPPCQSFSTAGRRGTVQDPRGTLLWQFLRFVEVMQPKLFLMENVRGLMSSALRHRRIEDRPERGGSPLTQDEQPGSVVRRFVSDLHGKYRLDVFEVNAVNYGAPQLRERVLFVGNRFGRVVNFPAPTHGPSPVEDSPLSLDLFPALQPFRTLRDAIGDLREENPVIMDFSERKKSFLALVPEGGNWRALPEAVAQESMGRAFFAKGGRSGWWRRLTYDLPAPTVVTMPNHASTALCHPIETRALTLRECARIQEFPDEWEFTGSPAERYAQVGNAVPVRLGCVAGEVLARELDSVVQSPRVKKPKAELVRVVYINSHVRTRQWFKNGKSVIWDSDSEESTTGRAAGKR